MLYNQIDLAEKVYLDKLERLPGDAKTLTALGYLYSAGPTNKEILKSIDYLNRSLNAGYKLPSVYNQLGLNFWNLSDYLEAKKMWREALGLDKNNEHAKYYLNQANELIK